MGYKQIKSFDPAKMGTRKGWCLANVAKGFGVYGVPGALPSAKADMEFNRNRGTLHPMSEYPSNCAVPVYLDTASPYEHVIVDDHGTLWSDGKRLSSLDGFVVFGWGEYCNSVRVVEKTSDPTPPSPTGFLPAKGYWCRYDIDPRVGKLASFMRRTFPAYTPAAALGNKYGDNLWKSVKEFQRRAHADGVYNAEIDGNCGKYTVAALEHYGFRP